ncbi:DUF4337 domain-containing protein [Candidatus Magnetominusculus dajiuhuensis]|uniref:DUF4337 domain-containing protein n=1 Tax=Candidatus Magnetominusculus dajiuhuensis TaxID=3137712 RepID=UPI003B427C27
MAEEKKEPWLNYLAMTTVLFAVLATLSTFKGGNFSTRALLSQSQSSDQWAFYQAKSIKGYIKELQKDKYETELKYSEQKLSGDVQRHYTEQLASLTEKIQKYETEKADIMVEARRLELLRDDAQKHSKAFGMAVIFLQIAILLGSISALMKKKPIWYLSMSVGAAGIVYFINGFLLVLPV